MSSCLLNNLGDDKQARPKNKPTSGRGWIWKVIYKSISMLIILIISIHDA